MKLFELAASPTKSAAKVFESYFGDSINVDVISAKQARMMLNKIQKLVNEHRATPAFHQSEKNPTYLKLMMMERVLATKVSEDMGGGATVAIGQSSNATGPAGQGQIQDPKAAALATAQAQEKKKQIQDQIKIKQKEIQDLQQAMNNPTMTAMAETRGSRARRLAESEVQQAQVVLAAQDMVDEVQKMSEQVSSMQFKDLPALVDQIKNQVGVDQAMQFNTDATTALAGLLQNLQGARQQLDQALGVVTGQAAPAIPGMDDGMAGELPPEGDLGAEPAPVGGDDINADIEIEEPAAGAGLGRAKR
jgi:hypothetical protein